MNVLKSVKIFSHHSRIFEQFPRGRSRDFQYIPQCSGMFQIEYFLESSKMYQNNFKAFHRFLDSSKSLSNVLESFRKITRIFHNVLERSRIFQIFQKKFQLSKHYQGGFQKMSTKSFKISKNKSRIPPFLTVHSKKMLTITVHYPFQQTPSPQPPK